MSDDQMLERLRGVLDDGTALEPSPERVAALRADVSARRAEGEQRKGTWAPTRRRRWWLAASAAAAAAFVVGAAVGHELPRPLRVVGHAIAPSSVESVDLHDARRALSQLGTSLAERDAEGACAADKRMNALVGGLDEDEKAKIVPVAHEVHERAVAFLARTSCELGG